MCSLLQDANWEIIAECSLMFALIKQKSETKSSLISRERQLPSITLSQGCSSFMPCSLRRPQQFLIERYMAVTWLPCNTAGVLTLMEKLCIVYFGVVM